MVHTANKYWGGIRKVFCNEQTGHQLVNCRAGLEPECFTEHVSHLQPLHGQALRRVGLLERAALGRHRRQLPLQLPLGGRQRLDLCGCLLLAILQNSGIEITITEHLTLWYTRLNESSAARAAAACHTHSPGFQPGPMRQLHCVVTSDPHAHHNGCEAACSYTNLTFELTRLHLPVALQAT